MPTMAAPDSFFGSAIYRFFNQPQNAGAAGYERTKEERRDYLRESHEAAFYQRTIHKEVKRKFPRGHDLFYHNNPVMGPHSWGGATKTHIAFLNQNAKKTLDATYE